MVREAARQLLLQSGRRGNGRGEPVDTVAELRLHPILVLSDVEEVDVGGDVDGHHLTLVVSQIEIHVVHQPVLDLSVLLGADTQRTHHRQISDEDFKHVRVFDGVAHGVHVVLTQRPLAYRLALLVLSVVDVVERVDEAVAPHDLAEGHVLGLHLGRRAEGQRVVRVHLSGVVDRPHLVHAHCHLLARLQTNHTAARKLP
mmetsp:Transcript_23524/g.58121  ORF Transcript_23524/g.58121 Transcript_23524/m.58121 type:complete len:200 (+) Transcript_23524:967-1566(+)